MTPTVELVYFTGCRHVERTRRGVGCDVRGAQERSLRLPLGGGPSARVIRAALAALERGRSRARPA